MSSSGLWPGPLRPKVPSGPRQPCSSSSSFSFARPAPGWATFPYSVQPTTWRAFAGQKVGTSAVVARRVRALQLLVAEHPHGHLWPSVLIAVDGRAEAACGCLQPWALPDAGLAFGPLPGQLPHPALGAHGTHHTPPTEMELPSQVQVNQEVSWQVPWETQTGKCSH